MAKIYHTTLLLMTLCISGIVFEWNFSLNLLLSQVSIFLDASNRLDKELERTLDNAAKDPKKIILFWHNDLDGSAMTFSRDLPRECGSCLVRDDTRLMTDNRTEAVIFHYLQAMPKRRPRQKRNLQQYWIWRCSEAPPYMRNGNWLNMADAVGFNMTLSYRSEADFRTSYARPIKNITLKNPLAKKRYLALIAVSNCNLTPGAIVRLKYLKEIITKGLNLTTMGACFDNLSIPKRNSRQMLEYTSQYKFYFAFENAYHCKDYVTEKFFRALQAGVVPVVWGATKDTYKSYIPASGFIFVEDFPSMQSLIDYLNYLDGNDTAYLEYFRWRQHSKSFNVKNYKRNTFACPICLFLHGINNDATSKIPRRKFAGKESSVFDRPERKVVPSIYKFWNEGDNPDCYKKNLQLDKNGRIVVK